VSDVTVTCESRDALVTVLRLRSVRGTRATDHRLRLLVPRDLPRLQSRDDRLGSPWLRVARERARSGRGSVRVGARGLVLHAEPLSPGAPDTARRLLGRPAGNERHAFAPNESPSRPNRPSFSKSTIRSEDLVW